MKRLAAESSEEREARLQWMQDRLASESAAEKEGRLQRMRINPSERLVAESVEEREDRRQRARERGTQANRGPLKQRSVQMKIRKLREYFVTLLQSVPHVQNLSLVFSCILQPLSISDIVEINTHRPKLYSSASGMDPGPLSSQLLVSKFTTLINSVSVSVSTIETFYIKPGNCAHNFLRKV